MTFFADLTPHTYTERDVENNVFNIGWLGLNQSFPTGIVPDDFVSALERLCSRPILLHCGFHYCEFCVKIIEEVDPEDELNVNFKIVTDADPNIEWHKIGNGQIRVLSSNGIWYCAPTMVHHYVTSHQYHPPKEFIDAVIEPVLVSEPELENDHQTWSKDIQNVFPNWQNDSKNLILSNDHDNLEVNKPISGFVIARAPSGIWLDIGMSVPALLLIEDMTDDNKRRSQHSFYWPKGTKMHAKIKGYAPEGMINLFQVA